VGDAWFDVAKVLWTLGEPDEAAEAAGEALALYQRKGNRPASSLAKTFIEAIAP
jgi:hypothetical protein